MINLEEVVQKSINFLGDEFNLGIKESRLKTYSQENWNEFCKVNNFNTRAGGIYIPSALTAYVNEDSPFLVPNTFHELFGHGMFFENSLLVHENPEGHYGLTKQDRDNYEGFAVWLESLLSNNLGFQNIWEQKKSNLDEYYRGLLEYFEASEKRLTKLGFMGQLGFPKFYSSEDVVDVVRALYGAEKFSNIGMIILYGSQKPTSDIDLCIISSNPTQQFYQGWIDIADLNYEEFNKRLVNLDIALTDALFTGKVIYGDKNKFEQSKKQVLDAPIDEEMIAYSKFKLQEQNQRYIQFRGNERLQQLAFYYERSYLYNVEFLMKGKKILTFENINKAIKNQT